MNQILIGKGEHPVYLLARYGNRHGIAGGHAQAGGQAPAGGQDSAGGPLADLLRGTKRRQGLLETMAKQAARSAGSQLGRQILRGVLGGILGGSRRR